MAIRHPEVCVRLSDVPYGTPYPIVSRVSAGLTSAGIPPEEVRAVYMEATSGDYPHLLRVALEWVMTS
jgi:hypothetical protein